MKYILTTLFVFLLISLGIGVYFFQKSKSVQTQTKAAYTTQVLPSLITDCNYLALPECPPPPNGVGKDPFVRSGVEQTIKKFAPSTIQQFTTQIDTSVFRGLSASRSLPTGNVLSASEIITQVSLRSGIDYRLLLTLFALNQQSSWYGKSSLTNPLLRNESGFANQFVGLAKDLNALYEQEHNVQSSSVNVGRKTYAFAQDSTIASRALYSYLAQQSTLPEDFERAIDLYKTRSPYSFRIMWQKFFNASPL